MLNINQIDTCIANFEKDIDLLNNMRKESLGYISDIENAEQQEDLNYVLKKLQNKGLTINPNTYKKNPFYELINNITKQISSDETKLHKIIEEIDLLEKEKEALKNKIYYSDLSDKMWTYRDVYINENGFEKDAGTAYFEELVGMVEVQKIKEFELEDYGFSFVTFDRIIANNKK